MAKIEAYYCLAGNDRKLKNRIYLLNSRGGRRIFPSFIQGEREFAQLGIKTNWHLHRTDISERRKLARRRR